MSGYRLYLMTDDGHIAGVHEAFRQTDSDALEWADEKREGCPAELWERARVVAKFDKAVAAA